MKTSEATTQDLGGRLGHVEGGDDVDDKSRGRFFPEQGEQGMECFHTSEPFG